MHVAVLGAGLQGACLALALAERGARVDLFDKESEPITQASLHSEGKIHLGFVYAKDATLATASLMAEGALAFAPLLQRWTGRKPGSLGLSSSFQYLVHRDSLLGPDELKHRYDAITGLIREASGRNGADYFGLAAAEPVERLSEAAFTAAFDDRRTAAAFRTPEVAVDPTEVAMHLRLRLSEVSAIRLRMNSRVLSASDTGDRAVVESVADGRRDRDSYDQVINALWDGRLVVDETAAAPLLRPWSFRTKFFLRVPPQGRAFRAPSTTIVLGPFGDIVNYASGAIFLSWYPAGRRSFSTDIAPPSLALTPGAGETLRKDIARSLIELVPGLSGIPGRDLAAAELRGGVIYALGDTDVCRADSLFHQRSRVGPRSYGRYHSVDTGKYTLAPLFAQRLADQLMGPV
jgi:glycine/D-amino acid oxidase-like deaminating enzyme